MQIRISYITIVDSAAINTIKENMMIKTVRTGIIVSTLVGLSTGYAGSMGPASTQALPCLTPFISTEASYTWNQLGNVTLNQFTMSNIHQGWGGRLGAGFVHQFSERLRFSTEIGGGYYGAATGSSASAGLSARVTIDGYDMLWGALYRVNQFDVLGNIDVFGSMGFMVENNRQKVTQDRALSTPGGFYSGVIVTKSNMTQVFPEIKVGGIYNLNDNWGISLAYMHVFGTEFGETITTSASAGSNVKNGTQNFENATLNSIMFGLRYSIV